MTPETRRREDRIRRARTGASHGAWLLLLIAILILANLLGAFLFARIDLTHDRRHTLADVSRQAVAELDGPLRVLVFLSEGLPAPHHRLEREVRDLLQEYRAHSRGQLHIAFIDPGLDEDDAERALNLGLQPVTIGEQSRDALSFREVWMGLALVYEAPDGDREAVIDNLFPGMNLEYELTRRIRELVHERERPMLGILVGDGSFFDELLQDLATNPVQPGFPSPDPQEARAMLAEQIAGQLLDDLHHLRFVDPDDDLDDLDALLIMGPRRAFEEDTIRRIDAFARSGRGVAALVSPWRTGDNPFGPDPRFAHLAPVEPNDTGLQTLLEAWGVQLNEDTLLDRETAQISVEFRTIGHLGDQPVTAPLPTLDPRLPLLTDLNRESLLTTHLPLLAFQPRDRNRPLPISSLGILPEALERETEGALSITRVASTSPHSVRRRNAPTLTAEQALQPLDTEELGGWPVIVTLEGTLGSPFDEEPGRGRVLVASNGDFITNVFNRRDPLHDPSVLRMLPPQVIQTVQQYGASSVLFLRNAADWLVADADLIAIRARGMPSFLEAESLQRERRNRIQLLNVAGVPLFFVGLGLGVLAWRRGRRRQLAERFASLHTPPTAAAETLGEDTPAAETPTKDTPAAEKPTEDTPATETPTKDAPAVETPAGHENHPETPRNATEDTP